MAVTQLATPEDRRRGYDASATVCLVTRNGVRRRRPGRFFLAAQVKSLVLLIRHILARAGLVNANRLLDRHEVVTGYGGGYTRTGLT